MACGTTQISLFWHVSTGSVADKRLSFLPHRKTDTATETNRLLHATTVSWARFEQLIYRFYDRNVAGF